jgi:hypothetical protein
MRLALVLALSLALLSQSFVASEEINADVIMSKIESMLQEGTQNSNKVKIL